MKILIFATENLTLTGGNLYDSLLYKTMKHNTSNTIEFCTPKIYKGGFALNKLFTPFIELKKLKQIKTNDYIFWNSVDAYHCILLLFCVKIFYPNKETYVIHHHYKFQEMSGIKKKIFKFFEINFLKLSNVIIIPSPYILNLTKKYLPKNKICYLELAFEDKKIINTEVVKQEQMVFVGNVEYRKGIHLLIESLKQLKNKREGFFKVEIIGSIIDTKYYNCLTKKIKEYQLEKNIVFRGRVSNEDKEHYLRTSSIFVFPSLLEGYGMAIMEAMQYGLPVVAFNNSAMPYIIKDGYNGLLAKNKCTEEFSNNLEKIFNNPDLNNTLKKGALETYSKCRKLPKLISEIENFTKKM